MHQRSSNLNCDMQHSTRGRLQTTSFHLSRRERLSDHTNKDMTTLCTLACAPLPGRSLFYWTRLLNNDMVGYSWRSTSRQDRVLNQKNFHIILFSAINSTLTSFRWNPNFRPRVLQSLLILWHTSVTLSAVVLYMVAAYVCGTAVYISGVRCTGSLISLLLIAMG